MWQGGGRDFPIQTVLAVSMDLHFRQNSLLTFPFTSFAGARGSVIAMQSARRRTGRSTRRHAQRPPPHPSPPHECSQPTKLGSLLCFLSAVQAGRSLNECLFRIHILIEVFL